MRCDRPLSGALNPARGTERGPYKQSSNHCQDLAASISLSVYMHEAHLSMKRLKIFNPLRYRIPSS